MTRTLLRSVSRHVLALVIVAATFALKLAIPSLGSPAPFLLLSLAVGVAAWLTGLRFGLAMAIGAAIAVNAIFVDHSATDALSGATLLVVGTADFSIMALAASRLRGALREEAEARTAAESAIRARDEFASTIAHELRNPLTTILVSSQLLERRSREAPGAEQAHAIAHEARRANQLIEDLLHASRLEVMHIDVASEPVDVAAVARSAGASFTARTAGRVGLALDLIDSAPVMGDAMRLEQVLANLLDNAAKYGPDGGTIELSVRLEGPEVTVRVSDRGIGVTREQAERLFDAFYRGRPSEGSGLGLGLHVSRAIVLRHDGELSYEPRPGGGSTFVMRLPLAAVGAQAQVATAPGD